MINLVRRFGCLAALVACLMSLPAAGSEADVATLTAGVDKLIAPGAIPGPVAVYSPDAFVVMTAVDGKVRLPLVAAARAGEGRVVVIGHGGFLSDKSLANGGNQRLLLNAAGWTSGKPLAELRAVTYRSGAATAVLQENGTAATAVELADLAGALANADLLVTDGSGYSTPTASEPVAAVQDFVRRGGGLIITGLGWGYKQLNPTRDLPTDFGGNRVLAPFGLIFADGYLRHNAPDCYVPDGVALAETHALRALELVQAGQNEPAVAAQISATMTNALRAVPLGDTLLLPRLNHLLGGSPPVPSAKQPVKLDQPLARLALIRQIQELAYLKPEEVTAHPAAAEFPGAVPAEAERVTAAALVAPRTPGWQGTGLYAGPGELLTVTVPDSAGKLDLSIRIGSHTDQLWHLDQWKRVPQVTLRQKLNAGANKVASAFGGLVYFELGKTADADPVELTVAGAVRAPRFVYGQTPHAAWRETIRHYPGPWAELESDKFVLTVPSELVRELDDPEGTLAFWNAGLDAIADLAVRPRERERAERMVFDVQISLGYMHSGYPIMAHLDIPKILISRDEILANPGKLWGPYHELGHNHQSSHWTFGGTTEVTVNLFTLYALDRVMNLPATQDGRVWGEKNQERFQKYLANGTNFDEWKREPFLALLMYAQLQSEFGWGAFRRVFAGYKSAAENELPKTDDEKRDQWLVRFSREVGRNLGPFFVAWGVPTSEAARASLSDLPTWMPADWPN